MILIVQNFDNMFRCLLNGFIFSTLTFNIPDDKDVSLNISYCVTNTTTNINISAIYIQVQVVTAVCMHQKVDLFLGNVGIS